MSLFWKEVELPQQAFEFLMTIPIITWIRDNNSRLNVAVVVVVGAMNEPSDFWSCYITLSFSDWKDDQNNMPKSMNRWVLSIQNNCRKFRSITSDINFSHVSFNSVSGDVKRMMDTLPFFFAMCDYDLGKFLSMFSRFKYIQLIQFHIFLMLWSSKIHLTGLVGT